jgi:hypothetical protein
MVRFVSDVRPSATAVFKAGDTQNCQIDFLSFTAGYVLLLIAFFSKVAYTRRY